MNLLISGLIRTAAEREISPLQQAVYRYAADIYELYLEALNNHKIDDVSQLVNVEVSLNSGESFTSTFKAGHHFIEEILHSREHATKVEMIQRTFSDQCGCENSDSVLESLNFIIMEVGSESIDPKEWKEALKGMNDCDDFPQLD